MWACDPLGTTANRRSRQTRLEGPPLEQRVWRRVEQASEELIVGWSWYLGREKSPS